MTYYITGVSKISGWFHIKQDARLSVNYLSIKMHKIGSKLKTFQFFFQKPKFWQEKYFLRNATILDACCTDFGKELQNNFLGADFCLTVKLVILMLNAEF